MDAIAWKIAVVQMDCALGDIGANLARIESFCRSAAAGGAELVVFPETALTGYFLGDRLAALAEPPDGPSAKRLGALARECGVHLAVGAYTADGGHVRNSQYLFGPDGRRLALYHKAHLFASERLSCRPGDEAVVVETALGRIGLTICYDLIFPDYIRRLVAMGADLIVNSTNWIADSYQREVWGWEGPTAQSLAAVRALENGTVVAMADRAGRETLEPPGIVFESLGHSCVAAPSGRILAALGAGEGMAIADVALAAEDLRKWRSIATYKEDRRPELYG
jgi:predicted amidohydrolase